MVSLLGSVAWGLPAWEQVSVRAVNARGEFDRRPVVGGCYWDESRSDFPGVYLRLTRLRHTKLGELRLLEAEKKAELEKLRGEHRQLLLTRDSSPGLEDRWDRETQESQWALAFADNIARQVQAKARWEEKLAAWEQGARVTVACRWEEGRKVLTEVAFPDSGVENAIARAR